MVADVSWVWQISNPFAAALLHNNNIRNNRLLHHQGSRVLHQNLCGPKLYTDAPIYIIKEPEYYTKKAPEYYTTTYATHVYYTESPEVLLCVKGVLKGERKGGRNQSSEHHRHGNICGALFVTNLLLHRETSSQSWLTKASCC